MKGEEGFASYLLEKKFLYLFEVGKFASAKVKKKSCTEYRQFQHCYASDTPLLQCDSVPMWPADFSEINQAVRLCIQLFHVVKNVSLDLEVKERFLEIELAYSYVQ